MSSVGRRCRAAQEFRAERQYLFSASLPKLRGAGFQTCRVAGFQAGFSTLPPAGLETRDTADLEVCATLNKYERQFRPGGRVRNWGWFWAAKYEISSGLVEIWPDGLAGIMV